MIEIARDIERRFRNSEDIFTTIKHLQAEGYVIKTDIYEGLKMKEHNIYYLDVYKDSNFVIRVYYTLRNTKYDKEYYVYDIAY